jgi:hypothetical protein
LIKLIFVRKIFIYFDKRTNRVVSFTVSEYNEIKRFPIRGEIQDKKRKGIFT